MVLAKQTRATLDRRPDCLNDQEEKKERDSTPVLLSPRGRGISYQTMGQKAEPNSYTLDKPKAFAPSSLVNSEAKGPLLTD